MLIADVLNVSAVMVYFYVKYQRESETLWKLNVGKLDVSHFNSIIIYGELRDFSASAMLNQPSRFWVLLQALCNLELSRFRSSSIVLIHLWRGRPAGSL